MKRKQTFIFGLLLGLLMGCQATVDSIIPTAAIMASVPNSSESTREVNAGLPPTWTPAAGEDVIVQGVMTLRPTGTATIRGDFPTFTPVPPTETAVILPSQTAFPTRTPTPLPFTPTPFPDIDYPRYPMPVARSGSKLGIHVIRNNSPEILNFVREARPMVIKAVDDLGFLAEVKQVSPQTITVGRINDNAQNYFGTPEEAARDWVNKQLPIYRLNPAVDYWEGWNEPDPNLNRMSWYARFEQERVKLLAQHGFRAAIGGFATGVPELNEFELFLPAIATALEYGGILTLHEYGAPDMSYLYGEPLPGYPAYPDRGVLNFRYRWYYRELLEPRGLLIPLIITEAGIDGTLGNRPGPDGYGWLDFQDYGIQQGWGNSGEQSFINQLAWYDRGVQEDPYVWGFTVFTAGGIEHWVKYDINYLLPRLSDYVRANR